MTQDEKVTEIMNIVYVTDFAKLIKKHIKGADVTLETLRSITKTLVRTVPKEE